MHALDSLIRTCTTAFPGKRMSLAGLPIRIDTSCNGLPSDGAAAQGLMHKAGSPRAPPPG